MNDTFGDWQNKPMVSITKDMVERRHRVRGETSKARANHAMRLLRALFYKELVGTMMRGMTAPHDVPSRGNYRLTMKSQ